MQCVNFCILYLYIFAVEQNGRQDFIRNAKTVTFDPSDSFEEKNVILEFLDDDINEATEGYFALLRVDEESSSNSEDMDKLEYIRDGVTLIVINDDDGKSLKQCTLYFLHLEFSLCYTKVNLQLLN